MAQVEINLRDIYRVLRKRKWVLIASPVLMGALTFMLTKPPAPVYEATTRVKITRTSVMSGVSVDYYQSYSPYDNMSTQILVVTSRPVLEEVARRMNMTRPGGDVQDAIDRLKGQIVAKQHGNSDILEITATAPSREQAIALANITAEVYIRQSSEAKYKRIDAAADFIRKQLEGAEQDSRRTEEEISQFKAANGTVLALNPGQALDLQEKRFQYQQKVQDVNSALALLARVQTTKEYFDLVQVDEPSVRALVDDITRRAGMVTDLRNKRAELLRYQKDVSPPVVTISNQLAAEERHIDTQMYALSRRLGRVLEEYQRLERTLRDQETQLNRQPIAMRDLENLQMQIRERREIELNLRKKLQEAEVQQKEKVEDISFVERAQSATRSAETQRVYQALIGMLVGLLLGGVFAFVLESLDTSIGTIEDVEEFIGASVLGVIPHIDVDDVKSRMKLEDFPARVSEDEINRFARLVTHFDPKSVAAESYRTLRTNLLGVMQRDKERKKQVILITSSVLQEGKTTSSCNLAVAFAQSGLKTLLIDADLRRPAVDRLFGVERMPGVSDILFGTQKLQETCRTVEDFILGSFGLKIAQMTPGLGSLYLLPAGRQTENPAELLNSPAMGALLNEARRDFDVVLVDVSPVLPVADASILAPKVDGIVMSYQIGRIGREVLKRSKLRLESLAGATILGIIMNDIQAEIDYKRSDYYYHYRYRYEPGADEPTGIAARWKTLFSRKSTPAPQRRKATVPAPVLKRAAPPKGGRPGSAADQELQDIMGLTDDK